METVIEKVIVWHTHHAVWELVATSTTSEIQTYLDNKRMRENLGFSTTTAPHNSVPCYDADGIKRSLLFWFERDGHNLKRGWVSKTSKDKFVYTVCHKASGTTLTYTKVEAIWSWHPVFNNEEQKLANHLRNVQNYYLYCGNKNMGWMADAVDMARNIHSETTVIRVVTVLEEELALKRMARERGDNDWRFRKEPLTRPVPSKKKRNKRGEV
jgi:hypothetical protein